VPDKTRVLFLSSPLVAGADTWIHFLLLRSLDRARFELHAAGQPARNATPSPAFDTLKAIPDLQIRPTDFGPSLFGQSLRYKLEAAGRAIPAAASLLGLARYIQRQRIQILHSTDRPRDAIACVALSALTGAHAVIHVHVKLDDWVGHGVRWAFGRAAALIGVSQFVAGSLVEGGYSRERVHAVLNAIEPTAWNPALDATPGRRSLGVSPDAKLIVSVARLFHWKGHAELIRALAFVRRQLPEAKLAIVGADYPEGSGVSAELGTLARELGVAEHVVFTGHRSDVASLLAACDVFALPSFEEPFGLVFAEAMAMKRPVVALDNGGTPEVVRHGRTGLLAAPGDIEGLASHLLTLLGNAALRAKMGDEGRRDVEARFTPKRLADDTEKVYASLR
jgi:glycosyltransferase involved in cell wall biosynthesis